MNLPDEAIEEFIEIYKAEHGVELSLDKAKVMACDLIEIYKILVNLKPYNSKEL